MKRLRCQLEGYMRDDKDVKALKTSADVEAELATTLYPEGAQSAQLSSPLQWKR